MRRGDNRYIQIQDLHKTFYDKPFEILGLADPLSEKPLELSSTPSISQGRIRLEDLDLNSLPDILLSFLVQDKQTKEKYFYSTVLMNHALKGNRSLAGEFTEAQDFKNVQTIAGKKSSLLVPFDVDENGRLDFLAQYISDDKNTQNGFRMIYNNFRKERDDQNFFLKLMVVYDHTQSSNRGSKDTDTILIDETNAQNVAANQD